MPIRLGAMMLDLPAFMQRAIDVAKRGLSAGEPPFGALVLGPSGEVIAELGEQVRAHRDMTRHAETEVVRLAVALRGPDLTGCSLVTTVEPCPMCFTAAWLARISHIVYGTTMMAVAAATGGEQREIMVPVERMNALSGNEVEVIGGIAHDACLELFSATSSSISDTVLN